jgi:hypothetical protein
MRKTTRGGLFPVVGEQEELRDRDRDRDRERQKGYRGGRGVHY